MSKSNYQTLLLHQKQIFPIRQLSLVQREKKTYWNKKHRWKSAKEQTGGNIQRIYKGFEKKSPVPKITDSF
jgi:hypothetical protein